MCGIIAWAGKNPAKFNKSKFDILGILNESRGKHSCGVTTDGIIRIGIDNNKLYKDFIQNISYEVPKLFPYAIGHTRQATFGAHDVHNAHPFGYGSIDNGDANIYEFLGVHNGSLLNHKDLAKSRNIDTTITTRSSKHSTTYRSKIDSEILLECIYNDKNFKVLSEYNGAAALVFININEPNVLYCYHGKSKEFDFKHSKVEEERPLYYYKETKNSLYISSIRESLTAIGGTDKTVGEFKHNVVYKITDGDISNAVETKIIRSKNYQRETYSNSVGCNFVTVDTYDEEVKKHFPSNSTTKGSSNSKENIYDEKVDINSYNGKIYFETLRYWRNGHRINGIWCYIGYGFNNLIFLGNTIKEAESTFWKNVNKPFHNGSFAVKNNNNNPIVPFIHNKDKEIINPPFLYFFDGIRLKDEVDYLSCLDAQKSKKGWTYTSLSCCSTHPIVNIGVYKYKDSQNIVLDNEPFTGSIAPLLSEKIYTIRNGNLHSWKYIDDSKENDNKEDDKPLLIVENVSEIFEDIKKKENVSENDEFLSERLEKEIEEIFTAPYKKYPSILKQLERYSHLPRGEEAIDVIETFIEGITNLITIEVKE